MLNLALTCNVIYSVKEYDIGKLFSHEQVIEYYACYKLGHIVILVIEDFGACSLQDIIQEVCMKVTSHIVTVFIVREE
jgi:hypothetical protein